MGRASSRKKISKATRSASRTRSSKNLGWWGLITVIVVLGVGLVALSRPDEVQAAPPLITDHWHAAFGINICGEVLPGLVDGPKGDISGIHSHGDGLIHIHPFSSRYTGAGANLGAFGDTTEMDLTDSSLEVPGRKKLKNGDKCPKDGKAGEVQVMVWDNVADQTGTLLKSDFAKYRPKDGSIVTIGFVPKGTKLDKPPSAGAIPSDVPGAVPSAPGAVPPAPSDPGAVPPASSAP